MKRWSGTGIFIDREIVIYFEKTERIEDKMPKKINHTLLLSAAINNTYIHRTVCVLLVAGDT